ncbi:hypothetical protein [Elizabethkingia meningoseptica]|uniref:hypothetical protein n=1 Tax=Elizabethkingia meningoseptica TaxID=238 RepID=UPI003891503C
MKTYISALLLAGITFTTISCNDRDDNTQIIEDQDTIGQEYKISGDFTYNPDRRIYLMSGELDYALPGSDRMLVFMWNGTDNGADVWSPVPNETYVDDPAIPNGRKVYYSYAFSAQKIEFYVKANYDITTTPDYLRNQRFSVLVVPANSANTSASVNDNNYNEVIRKYRLDSSRIINIFLK